VIVALGDKPTPTAEELALALTELKPGQSVKVKLVRRGAQRLTVTVKLGAAPGG
jgi:S1-C subfamily serine protease